MNIIIQPNNILVVQDIQTSLKETVFELLINGISQTINIDFYISDENTIVYMGKETVQTAEIKLVDQVTAQQIPTRDSEQGVNQVLPAGSIDQAVNVQRSAERVSNTSFVNTLKDLTQRVYQGEIIIPSETTRDSSIDIKSLRPKISKDFCIYTPEEENFFNRRLRPLPPNINYSTYNPPEGFVVVDPSFEADSIAAGNNSPTLSRGLTGITPSLYPPDLCISQAITEETDQVFLFAQPGDLNYAGCGLTEDVRDPYNADWASVINFVFPEALGIGAEGSGGPPCTNNPFIGRTSTGPGGQLLRWVDRHGKCISVVYQNGWQESVVQNVRGRYGNIRGAPSASGGSGRCRVMSGFIMPGCGGSAGEVCVPDKVYWEISMSGGVKVEFIQTHKGDFFGLVGGPGGTGTITKGGDKWVFDANRSIRHNVSVEARRV